MTIITTEQENCKLRAEAAIMLRAAKRIASDPKKAREFLIKGGFMTAGGKLSKRYGG